jgi:hypothetical protein
MTVVLDRVSPENMRRGTGGRADAALAADCLAGLSH